MGLLSLARLQQQVTVCEMQVSDYPHRPHSHHLTITFHQGCKCSQWQVVISQQAKQEAPLPLLKINLIIKKKVL